MKKEMTTSKKTKVVLLNILVGICAAGLIASLTMIVLLASNNMTQYHQLVQDDMFTGSLIMTFGFGLLGLMFSNALSDINNSKKNKDI